MLARRCKQNVSDLEGDSRGVRSIPTEAIPTRKERKKPRFQWQKRGFGDLMDGARVSPLTR